jgi:hypothetical protein
MLYKEDMCEMPEDGRQQGQQWESGGDEVQSMEGTRRGKRRRENIYLIAPTCNTAIKCSQAIN